VERGRGRESGRERGRERGRVEGGGRRDERRVVDGGLGLQRAGSSSVGLGFRV
jgi:hypothetical protein